MVDIAKAEEYQLLYNISKKVLSAPYERWKIEEITPLIEQIIKEDKVLRKELKNILKKQKASLAINIVDHRQSEISWDEE